MLLRTLWKTLYIEHNETASLRCIGRAPLLCLKELALLGPVYMELGRPSYLR